MTLRAVLHHIELLPSRAVLHSLLRSQQQPKWTKTVVQYSSLCSDSEERLALLPGNGASRISSRSSGYTARGSQTPDLGTVRESAGSRGFFLHGRSTSRAAHLLSKSPMESQVTRHLSELRSPRWRGSCSPLVARQPRVRASPRGRSSVAEAAGAAVSADPSCLDSRKLERERDECDAAFGWNQQMRIDAGTAAGRLCSQRGNRRGAAQPASSWKGGVLHSPHHPAKVQCCTACVSVRMLR